MRRREYRITIRANDDEGQTDPHRYFIKQRISAEMVERANTAGHSLEATLRDSAHYAIAEIVKDVQEADE